MKSSSMPPPVLTMQSTSLCWHRKRTISLRPLRTRCQRNGDATGTARKYSRALVTPNLLMIFEV
jgi:hypothetical protein